MYYYSSSESSEQDEMSHSTASSGFRLYGIGRFLALVIRLRSINEGEPLRLGIDGDRDFRDPSDFGDLDFGDRDFGDRDFDFGDSPGLRDRDLDDDECFEELLERERLRDDRERLDLE